MSAIGLRGHQPRTVRFTTAVELPASADVARVHLSAPTPTAFLQIRNEENVVGGNTLRVYWLEADFDAAPAGTGVNFFDILPASEFEGPAEVKEFWVRSVGGPIAAVTVIFYLRQG